MTIQKMISLMLSIWQIFAIIKYTYIKFIILTTFTCTIQRHQVNSCYVTITTTNLQNFFYLSKTETLYSLRNLLYSPFPQPLAAIILPSVSMNLTTLESSRKWNHAVFVLLCLAYLAQPNVFKVHPCCSMYQDFLPFRDEITFCCVYLQHSVYLFTHQWTFGLPSPFGYCA